MAWFRTGGGGSIEVSNGVLQEVYSSSGVIDRNTFIEYDEYPYNQEIAEKGCFFIQTISLTESLGLLAYAEPDSTGYSSLKVKILRTPGVSVVMENAQTLFTNPGINSYWPVALVKISTTQALLFYIYGNGASFTVATKLSAVILTVNDTTISVGTSVAVETTNYYLYRCISVKQLSSDKFFVGYKRGNSSGGGAIIAVICIVNGNTISFGTKLNVKTTTSNSRVQVDVQPLANGKVLYVMVDDYPFYSLCSVSGTTISSTNPERIAGSYNTFTKLFAIEVSDNVVLVLMAYEGSYSETFWCVVGNATTTTVDWGTIVTSWIMSFCNLCGLKYASNQAITYIPIAKDGSTTNYVGINKVVITVDPSTKTPTVNRIKCSAKEDLLYNQNTGITVAQKSSEIFLVGYLRWITDSFGNPRIFVDTDLATVHKSINVTNRLSKNKITPENLGEVWVLNKES